MRKSLYKYNPQTCQYEHIRVKPGDVIWYSLGVIVMAVLILAALLVVHDVVVDSEKEIALRKENAAMEKNQVILTNQLNSIESTLSSLDKEDRKLNAKFFGTASDAKNVVEKFSSADHRLLLANASAFRIELEKISEQSSFLLKQSAQTNIYFKNEITLGKKELAFLRAAMPASQPVQPWDAKKVISGFGMRINPFHKGLYEHAGIDIAMPRGTEVNATGSGTVREIKRSNLEAGYGNYVEIDHGHGFITRYAHLEDIKVKAGQSVTKGAIIGTIGSSGGSIAPHLHYEIIRDGKNVNPVAYMIEGLNSKDHHYLKSIGEQQNQSLD
jgi:murein DD-endopeptidase MepM/ murein hydrolase activator NlpD